MSVETSERRERKDAQRNLERVLHAAHELFAERGADVTMEEVARRAGVGVGTIYRRFPSKDLLFAAVSQAACADTRHCLQAATQAQHDPLLKLRALVLTQYQRCGVQSALLDLHPAAEATTGPTFEQQQLYDALHRMLQQVIAEGQREGAIRQDDPAALAALCLELLSPRAFEHLARVVGRDAEDAAEYTLRFVLGGLRGAEDEGRSL
ncbi:MAG: TetR/AcrR family transcriptional regulator [Kouleothrix sp.]|nr:TetR/AcrR family transcriptional regulator [Kouleothrix sp.]